MHYNTTISVPTGFPLRQGEVLRIKTADGKRIWRKYTVGPVIEKGERREVFAAKVERG